MLDEKVKRSLSALFPARQVVIDPTELITYERDAALDCGTPGAVVFPHSADEVVRLVRWASGHGLPLVPRGAGTGLSGGAVAEHGGVVVAFSRLSDIVEIDRAGRSAVVEPGTVNAQLDEAAKSQGLYFPPDPASGRSSTIGGNIAENSGGPHCFKYGVTTNYVTGLQVVLADGRLLNLGGRALDYPGYDLCGLITGSEGTLAIVTQATVRLAGNPGGARTLMAVFDSVEQAGQAVSTVIAAGLVPATMEMMDQKIIRIVEDHAHAGLPTDAGAILIAEVDGHAASLVSQAAELTRLLREQGAREVRAANDVEERERIWYARKSAAGALSRLAPSYFIVDGTVPRSRLAETLAAINIICESRGLRVGHVFHAGDGNLHPLLLVDDPGSSSAMERVKGAAQQIYLLCVAEGGSITGEHGVGIDKRAHMPLMYSADELRAMWDIKDVFDPARLLNPGKMLPPVAPSVRLAAPAPPVPASPFSPSSDEDAAAGIRACAAAARPVRFTGSAGGTARSDSLILSTAALSNVRTYAKDDLYVTAGAGTRLADLQQYLARDRMQVPLASPWAAATLGGLAAANVNGPLRMRYGSLRDLVLAATVVLGDGRLIRMGRPVVKNVAGYDVPKVMIGSEGSLGLIADLTLKLVPLPRARRTLHFPARDSSRALAWAAAVLPRALVASSIVVTTGCSHSGETAPFLMTYTAEGWPGDVASELRSVVEVLSAAGAPAPEQGTAVSGTDLWARLLGSASPAAVVVRVGLAPKYTPGYMQSIAASLTGTRFLVDLPAGILYAVWEPAGVDEAATWLDAVRRQAISRGGYAVVTQAPTSLDPSLDPLGYRPPAYDLMHSLKARWDPAGILNPDALVTG